MKKNQQNQQNQQAQKKPSSNNDTAELTFLEHLYELRSRLFWIVTTIILASAAGFQFKDQLIAVVMDPLHGQKLVYLTPGGGFGFIFTLAIYFGVLIAIPVIIYHVYGFLRPLLKAASRKLVVTFMFTSFLLAASGAAFGYFVTIPAALDFLATFAGDAVTPNLTAESYLNFVVTYILGLAFLFQLPLLLFIFDHVRPFPPGSLLASQRFVIIGATIVAAVITPTPDAFNMAIVAVPIVAMYQLGVIAVALRHRALKRKAKKMHVQSEVVIKSQDESTAKEDNEIAPVNASAVHLMQNSTTETPYRISPGVHVQEKPRAPRTIDGVVRARPVGQTIVPQRFDGPKQSSTHRRIVKPVRTIDGFGIRRRATIS